MAVDPVGGGRRANKALVLTAPGARQHSAKPLARQRPEADGRTNGTQWPDGRAREASGGLDKTVVPPATTFTLATTV